MDILPLGERRIIFSRIGLARGEDGRPEVTRIHPNLFFAGAPCRLGGHYTSMERPDMSFSASSERAANGGLVFRPFSRRRASAEILRERVKAGISQARARGQPHGRTTDRQSKQCRN
jgi:hypothetical protein